MSNTKYREISESNSQPGIEVYSDHVRILESKAADEDLESIGEMVVARKLVTDSDLQLSSLLPKETNIALPTVTKETVTKYRSRPSVAPATPDATTETSIPIDAAKAKDDEKRRSSKADDAQGYKVMGRIRDTVTVTSNVTNKVADKVKDILTGKVIGKVTAKVTDKVTSRKSNLLHPLADANAAAQDRSRGQEDKRRSQRVSSADMVTLSNPRIPSVVLQEDTVGAKKRSAFPHPFYSTLGRYRPHGPGDEAFSPITLTMTFDAEDGSGQAMRRPTVTIRKTTIEEKQGSRTTLYPPSATPGGAAGGAGGAGAGAGGRAEESKQVEQSVASDTNLETESVLSTAMMKSVVSIMKFYAQSSAQERESAALASTTPAAEVASDSAAVDGQVPMQTGLLPSVPVTEDDLETLRLSVRAIIGLQRWKKRASARINQKAGPYVTVKTFAKNPQHGNLLQKNLEEITTELPLPLKRTLYGEAFPILNDVYQAYERTLGKTNNLTEQARAKIESMTNFMKMYDEM